jgi:hypothetical protein
MRFLDYRLFLSGEAAGPSISSLLLEGSVDVARQEYCCGMDRGSLICNMEELLVHLPCICLKEDYLQMDSTAVDPSQLFR